MIKDLMASAGSNKAANLADKTSAKGASAEDGQNKGLFGLLFQSMQAEESSEGEGDSTQAEVQNAKKTESAEEGDQKAEGDNKASIDTIAAAKIKNQENTEDSVSAEGENEEAVVDEDGSSDLDLEISKSPDNDNSESTENGSQTTQNENKVAHEAAPEASEIPETEEKNLPDMQQGSSSNTVSPEAAASLKSESEGNRISKSDDSGTDKVANTTEMAGDSKSGISLENADPKTVLTDSEVKEGAEKPVKEKAVINLKELKAEAVSLSKGEPGFISAESGANSNRASNTVSADQAKEKENIVNTIRGRSAKHTSGQESISNTVVTEADQETVDEQKKLFNGAFMNKKAADPLEKGAEISSVKVEQLREERYRKHFASFANRSESSEGRVDFSSAGRPSLTNNEIFKSISQLGFQNAESSVASDQQAEMNQLLWKDHTSEIFEAGDKKGSEQYLNFMRLGQIPISNLSARRDMVSGFTQGVLKAVGGGKSTPETWQKHNFVLEDGKNINLSARQTDGVLQLKIGSSHGELGRLLQLHQDEIRQHLEKECGLEVDLQFENQQDGEMSEFFGESSSSQQIRKGLSGSGDQQNSSKSANQVLTKTVRKFGYNRMEWTA